MRPSYEDAALLRVREIDPPLDGVKNPKGVLYLYTRGDFIVLKLEGKQAFRIIRSDTLNHIELRRDESGTAAQ